MAPAIDPPRGTSPWTYVAFGCGGCAVLLVVALFVVPVLLAFFTFGSRGYAPFKTPARTSPYKFQFKMGVATCKVALPDNSGEMTYMQVLGNGTSDPGGHGVRAVRLTCKGKTSPDLPLSYYTPVGVRVGLYWCPARNGSGPYVRFYDACGEGLVNVGSRKSIAVKRVGAQVYGGDFVDNENYEDWGTDPASGMTFDGKPPYDITPIIGKNKGKYFGSIVRVGNTLTFDPASKTGSPAGSHVRP